MYLFIESFTYLKEQISLYFSVLKQFTLSMISMNPDINSYKPYGHHGCYLVEKVVSNILKKAHGRKFDKERMQFIDFIVYNSLWNHYLELFKKKTY